MRCHRVKRLLCAYLDDELEPNRRASLESHVVGCEACSAELAKLRAQWDALVEGDQAPVLPADLWPQVLAALDEAERLPWHRRYRARLLQAACVTACVILGFAGGAFLSWKAPAGDATSNDISIGERTMVAEAFDTTAFGLSEGKEGLLRCVPK
jgi:anti-sigma factor RsiW